MTEQANPILLAFYGDDFTGSTDALESLSLAGAKTMLFIEAPSRERLQRYKGLHAIGVAGMSRAMIPADMEVELKQAFSALQLLEVSHVHYKVCSTFDSSPGIGSIGKAIDTGADIFRGPFVPLVVGAPALGRYCVFGNLFARMGIGSTGQVYRLDRHPSMKAHPVTPASESDLRLHLSKQTTKQIELVDILQMPLSLPEKQSVVERHRQDGADIILFDTMYEDQLAGIGQLIDSYAATGQTLFSVGSSSIGSALAAHWQQVGLLPPAPTWNDPGMTDTILVVSGSCSPVTSAQIDWAINHGFASITIDTVALATSPEPSHLIVDHIVKAIDCIQNRQSVIIHTGGGESSRVAETTAILGGANTGDALVKAKTADLYGTILGRIARAVAAQSAVKRIVIAGGDTSSFAARAMGIEAVEMIAPLSPGAPLCKAYAPGSPIDGLEVNFKGGQVGKVDYFGMVQQGKFT